jgi:hypothetical protein
MNRQDGLRSSLIFRYNLFYDRFSKGYAKKKRQTRDGKRPTDGIPRFTDNASVRRSVGGKRARQPEPIRSYPPIGRALTVKTRPKQSAPARAERAKALAGKVIDSFSTAGTDVEETASRKRRLLKGPEEFRDIRVDRPKAKTK